MAYRVAANVGRFRQLQVLEPAMERLSDPTLRYESDQALQLTLDCFPVLRL